MKIKGGFIVKKVVDDFVVVPVNDNFMEFSSVINLNETGCFLWKCLENDVTLDFLCESLAKEYEVEANEVKEDVINFVDNLKKADLIEE